MGSSARAAASRRKFLQFLAGSPLLAGAASRAFAGEGVSPGTKLPDPLAWAPMRTDELIASPKEAINVFDFEPVCRKNVPPAHFGYMASGIDDEATLRANREGFLKFQLRPRRLAATCADDAMAYPPSCPRDTGARMRADASYTGAVARQSDPIRVRRHHADHR